MLAMLPNEGYAILAQLQAKIYDKVDEAEVENALELLQAGHRTT
jgi:hypothetical protein